MKMQLTIVSLLVFASVAVAQTPLANLMLRTNSAGELLIANAATGTGQGPATNMANLPGKVNSSNELLVACSDCGANGVGQLFATGTAPAVSNTSANSCGTTAATLAGTDSAGRITVGATSGTSCTVTFATAYTPAPACVANNETTGNLARATATTTTVTIAGTFVAADKLTYVCVGF